jgi:hypothetical protein
MAFRLRPFRHALQFCRLAQVVGHVIVHGLRSPLHNWPNNVGRTVSVAAASRDISEWLLIGFAAITARRNGRLSACAIRRADRYIQKVGPAYSAGPVGVWEDGNRTVRKKMQQRQYRSLIRNISILRVRAHHVGAGTHRASMNFPPLFSSIQNILWTS